MNASLVRSNTEERESEGIQPALWFVVLEVILIFGLCWAYAGQAAPHVNETHYLTKAKSYWNPGWCFSDSFLDSSNPHLLFYLTFGWLTIFLPLASVAWIGRVLTWVLLATSWRSLSSAFTGKRYLTVFTAALFILLLDRCHLAGEWVVGGVEAKGFAFAFVFWGLAAMLRSQWKHAWIYFGIASAFHVLVGGWSCLAAMAVFLFFKIQPTESQPSFRSQLLPLAIGGTISLIGILPPILSSRGIPAEDIHLANVILVTQRLSHHQLFGDFATQRVASFLALVFAWLVCFSLIPKTKQLKSLGFFATFGLFVALIGILLSGIVESDSNSPAVDLLIYYWFRLSDFAVPLAATFTLVAGWMSLRRANSTWFRLAGLTAAVAIAGLFSWICVERWSDERPFAVQSSMATYPENQKRTLETYQNWRKACEWVRTNTPRDSRFLTPAKQQTFKWYAERAEIVSWKDVPQDPAGVIGWYGEIQRFHRVQLFYPSGIWAYNDQQLRDIATDTGATHIISFQSELDAREGAPPDLKQLYPENPDEQSTFVVFRLDRE